MQAARLQRKYSTKSTNRSPQWIWRYKLNNYCCPEHVPMCQFWLKKPYGAGSTSDGDFCHCFLNGTQNVVIDHRLFQKPLVQLTISRLFSLQKSFFYQRHWEIYHRVYHLHGFEIIIQTSGLGTGFKYYSTINTMLLISTIPLRLMDNCHYPQLAKVNLK